MGGSNMVCTAPAYKSNNVANVFMYGNRQALTLEQAESLQK